MRLILALFCNQFLFYVDNIFGVKKKNNKNDQAFIQIKAGQTGTLFNLFPEQSTNE